jgi:peroxiredoxin
MMSAISQKGAFALFLSLLSVVLSAQIGCEDCDSLFSTQPMTAHQLFESKNPLDSVQKLQAIQRCANTKNHKLRYEGLVEGQVFPPFVLEDVHQKEIRLPDFAGKMVHIEFWATWSPVAVQHMQQMQSMIRANTDTSCVYLWVSVEPDAQRWRKYVIENQLVGYHVLDQQQLISMYCNVQAIPNYFLVDEKGKVVMNSTQKSDFQLNVFKK